MRCGPRFLMSVALGPSAKASSDANGPRWSDRVPQVPKSTFRCYGNRGGERTFGAGSEKLRHLGTEAPGIFEETGLQPRQSDPSENVKRCGMDVCSFSG